MRGVPHARGWCHPTNYWTAVQILSSDIDGSYSIPMPHKPACPIRTMKHAPLRFAFAHMPAAGTCLAGIGLFLQDNLHPQSLCLVGEQMSRMPM